jgi:hypothetical protein
MTVRSLLKRAGVVTAASTALVLAGTTSASAWHCFVPMYSLNGPTQDKNWIVFTAEVGAAEIAGYSTPCDEARDAGYAALEEAGLPVGIKIFEKMTIGEGANLIDTLEEGEHGPTGSGQGATQNRNGADGKGLEYFMSGSTLPDEMLATYIAAAETVDCGAAGTTTSN